MIRIDELYNNTFWPYIQKNIPLTRLFYCDPPGTSHPDNLLNHGNDVTELNYILLHDQEPIHLDIHTPLFDDVSLRNEDLNNCQGPVNCAIVHSEYNSYDVKQLTQKYNWHSYYHFWHGWASLDWYNRMLCDDDYVLGACLFEVGHAGDWKTFRHLGKDNEGRHLEIIDKIKGLKDA